MLNTKCWGSHMTHYVVSSLLLYEHSLLLHWVISSGKTETSVALWSLILAPQFWNLSTLSSSTIHIVDTDILGQEMLRGLHWDIVLTTCESLHKGYMKMWIGLWELRAIKVYKEWRVNLAFIPKNKIMNLFIPPES